MAAAAERGAPVSEDAGCPAGWRQFSVCGSRFQLPEHYRVIKPIGQGAYGVVCSATNTTTGENVAIKKIANAFDHVVDTKRTLREAKLLRLMKHENIIGIRDILPPVDVAHFNDVYVISELMDTDLHQIIVSPQPLSDDHMQYFMYQILRGIKYIHGCNVVHRDLKPSNLLLNSNCDLKICDFGLARSLGPSDNGDDPTFLTEYVATRWYRAPEVLLSWCRYTKALDMWSIGCIFAELLGRRPIFPGRNYKHQIELICNVLGTPSEQDLRGVTSQKALNFLHALKPRPMRQFPDLFTTASPPALSLVQKLLTFDPDRRLTVEECLSHPFLESLHDADDEPGGLGNLDFDWENQITGTPQQSKAKLKELLYEEIRLYHQDIAPWEVATGGHVPAAQPQQEEQPQQQEEKPWGATEGGGGAGGGGGQDEKQDSIGEGGQGALNGEEKKGEGGGDMIISP